MNITSISPPKFFLIESPDSFTNLARRRSNWPPYQEQTSPPEVMDVD